MVFDAEGIKDGIVLMDCVPEEIVKAVLVHAIAGSGAVETAEAAALEREILYVNNVAFVRKNGLETVNHSLQLCIFREKVRNNNRFLCCTLNLRGIELPKQEIQPVNSLLPPFFRQDIIHIRGESVKVLKTHIGTIVLNETVGSDVVKMLGC